MEPLRSVMNLTHGRVVFDRVRAPATPAGRAQGLLGRGSLGPGEGMWIAHCGLVHTFFMKFSIDLAFLDRSGRVLKIVEGLSPWRVAGARGASAVLEAAAGSLAGRVAAGEVLEMR